MSTEFRDICNQHGLAATYQRQVIYETVMSLPGHPSTETIFEKAKQRIPSISLATVYKNIRTFLDSGVFQEVSFHHGSLRVETNRRPHHHLVCTRCKSMIDLETEEFEPVHLKNQVPQDSKYSASLSMCSGFVNHVRSRSSRLLSNFYT